MTRHISPTVRMAKALTQLSLLQTRITSTISKREGLQETFHDKDCRAYQLYTLTTHGTYEISSAIDELLHIIVNSTAFEQLELAIPEGQEALTTLQQTEIRELSQ